jgi:hypothetical protein
LRNYFQRQNNGFALFCGEATAPDGVEKFKQQKHDMRAICTLANEKE